MSGTGAPSPADALTGFVWALRAAGMDRGPDETAAFLAAAGLLGAERRDHVHRAGRATLCRRHEDLATYDAVFTEYFGGAPERLRPAADRARSGRDAPSPDADAGGDVDPEALVTASRRERLRSTTLDRLPGLSAADRAAAFQLLVRATQVRPRRRARHGRPGAHGRVDLRRSVRAALPIGGEPARLRHRRPGRAPRRVVMIVDVSGSMHGYAQGYLLGAAAVLRGLERVEVFATGTRLTRVTPALRSGDLLGSPAAAAALVPDWHGGTTLGRCLSQLTSARTRSALRGALVVVLSDGWEQGSTTELAEAMRRVARLAKRVYWASPHAGRADFTPQTAGLRAALPYVDRLVGASTVADLAAVLGLLAGAPGSVAAGAHRGSAHRGSAHRGSAHRFG